MKKNKTMRIAAVLLVLCLATTCAISGTFAKYTTSATGGDTARVAKWGVEITVSGDFFSETYDAADSFTVKSNTSGENVVAPGTSGSLAEVALKGTPEVAVEVTYVADLKLTGWALADGTVYCPIVITVGTTEYKIDATNTTTALLEAAVEKAIADYSTELAANNDLSNATINTPVVAWSWAYEGGNDSADTYLGNQAAIGNAPTIELTITTTVTQVD